MFYVVTLKDVHGKTIRETKTFNSKEHAIAYAEKNRFSNYIYENLKLIGEYNGTRRNEES